MNHAQLIQAAKDAIDQLHSDTTVSRTQTMEDLKDVREHLDAIIDALQATTPNPAD